MRDHAKDQLKCDERAAKVHCLFLPQQTPRMRERQRHYVIERMTASSFVGGGNGGGGGSADWRGCRSRRRRCRRNRLCRRCRRRRVSIEQQTHVRVALAVFVREIKRLISEGRSECENDLCVVSVKASIVVKTRLRLLLAAQSELESSER